MSSRFGQASRSRRRGDETVRSQITAAQASTLGLLALILGFTMSMAESRFNGSRANLVREAAAVGTTSLRADYLPEPARTESRQLLRDYVKACRAYYRATSDEAPSTTVRAQAIHAGSGRAPRCWRSSIPMPICSRSTSTRSTR